MSQPNPILIIGAGQAGLATAYHLHRLGMACALVDAHERVGDSWRLRWDSLRVFSPARYSSLPGWAMPFGDWYCASKDEVADYLEAYAQRFEFALQMGTRVLSVSQSQDGLLVQLQQGERSFEVQASAVVVATGTFGKPFVPQLPEVVDAAVFQVHAANYKNPGTLPDGPALVVGTGASGTQIAAELAASRKVYLSGPKTGHVPRSFLGRDIYWWLHASGAMAIQRDSWLGRRMFVPGKGGDVLVGKSLKLIVREAGLVRRGMLVGFENGLPRFEDGAAADDIRSIVWATGYRNDYGWLPSAACDAHGQPKQQRGVASDVPNLYFVGLKFMHRGDSSNLGGVGRDAEYIARQISAGK